jgi:hypothetical protein
MKMSKKLTSCLKKLSYGVGGMVLSCNVFAEDVLASAMNGVVKDSLGSQGTFWTIFILVDIMLSIAAAVKTKNPMVFAGVFAIALIPGVLINAFVFK